MVKKIEIGDPSKRCCSNCQFRKVVHRTTDPYLQCKLYKFNSVKPDASCVDFRMRSS